MRKLLLRSPMWGQHIETCFLYAKNRTRRFSDTLLSFVRRKARSTCIARFNLSKDGSSPSNMLRQVDDRLHTHFRNVHVESVSPIFVIIFPDLQWREGTGILLSGTSLLLHRVRSPSSGNRVLADRQGGCYAQGQSKAELVCRSRDLYLVRATQRGGPLHYAGESRLVCLAGRAVFLCFSGSAGLLQRPAGSRAAWGALLVCVPAHGPASAQEVSGQDR